MPNDLATQRHQCTQDLAAALIQTAAEVLTKHGDDPQSPVILAAGFAMALREIGKNIDPTIPQTVRTMLGDNNGRSSTS